MEEDMATFSKDYYKNTKDLEPSPLLIEALGFPKTSGKTAIDLGCGAGRDTRLLLKEGFDVVAVDSEPSTESFMNNLYQLGNLTFVLSTFVGFHFKNYDLINARYSLPFNPSDSFPGVMSDILKSLNSGGIFVGQLFGVNDGWNTGQGNMTFHTRLDVENLFSAFEIIKLAEKDEVGLLADGSRKHWHVFDIIARQK